MKEELKDIIDCILKWDTDGNSPEANTQYFKVIQRDLKAIEPVEQKATMDDKPMADIDSIMNWLNQNGIGTGTNLTVRSTAGLIQGFIAQWVLPYKQQPEITTHDTPKCKLCGGRTALVTGYFAHTPDDEPYQSGVYEKAKVTEGECWAGGYKCDDCGNVQDIWHE